MIWDIGLENMISYKGVDAKSMGRDNGPRGLGDMPDSQGPFGSEPIKGQIVREPYISPSYVSIPTAPI